jgi:hypothetical protein
MKKAIFSINFTDNTIYGSKSALKKASNPATAEHKELMNLLATHPTFKVAEKEPNTKKTTYKGMGFKMMADYISTQDNAEELMAEFETAKMMFGGKYPLVKKWFLDTFGTEEKPFDMNEAREVINAFRIQKATENAETNLSLVSSNVPAEQDEEDAA